MVGLTESRATCGVCLNKPRLTNVKYHLLAIMTSRRRATKKDSRRRLNILGRDIESPAMDSLCRI